jgi:hypothetical protein
VGLPYGTGLELLHGAANQLMAGVPAGEGLAKDCSGFSDTFFRTYEQCGMLQRLLHGATN